MSTDNRSLEQRAKPLCARPLLQLQIRLLNKTAFKLVRVSNALRTRANRLTDEAVRAYRAGKGE